MPTRGQGSENSRKIWFFHESLPILSPKKKKREREGKTQFLPVLCPSQIKSPGETRSTRIEGGGWLKKSALPRREQGSSQGQKLVKVALAKRLTSQSLHFHICQAAAIITNNNLQGAKTASDFIQAKLPRKMPGTLYTLTTAVLFLAKQKTQFINKAVVISILADS